jgi:hypothetical protein
VQTLEAITPFLNRLSNVMRRQVLAEADCVSHVLRQLWRRARAA